MCVFVCNGILLVVGGAMVLCPWWKPYQHDETISLSYTAVLFTWTSIKASTNLEGMR